MPKLLRIIQPLLSMMTPRYIHLRFYVGRGRNLRDQPVWEHLYKSWQLEAAIEAFLQGASPSDQVQFGT